METDGNAAFNAVAVFAPILLILATSLTVFHRLRARWPVKVNCWFCNENTKIRRQHRDWWLCPWCEQYNGFSKGGDYAYDIPEQYAMPKVCTRYCKPGKLKETEGNDSRHVVKDSLCACCIKRESLKLSELSSFEPKNKRHYDTELKLFKEYLETRYPLCNSCKSTVRDVLHRQAVWLTRYKMLLFRQKPIRALFDNARKSETIFRAISTVLVSMVVYNQDYVWLPIGGLLVHLCACWASSRNRNPDILLIVFWFCIIFLVFGKSLTSLQDAWLTTEYVVLYRMVVQVCAFITALLSLRSSLCKATLTGSVAFKTIKLRSRDAAPPQLAFNDQSGSSDVSSELNDSIKPSVYAASESSSTEIKFSKSHSAMLRQKLFTITGSYDTNAYANPVSQNECSPSDNCCLNDSLNSLLLNEDSPRCSRIAKAAPAIFERRVYSATSSENLFRKSGGAYSKRRCILSPPKLRSVTQTSWVAGGYWQEGMMTATPLTLSRSSSQSSGFGSVSSSNLAPSREPSVHEFDRCSVVSEPARWSCQTPRPGSRVARHDSPAPRPQSRYSDATVSSLAVRATRDDSVREACGRESSVGERNGMVPAYAGHYTTTVIASPGWLSALLCGSLILNMIVLCTTLLR